MLLIAQNIPISGAYTLFCSGYTQVIGNLHIPSMKYAILIHLINWKHPKDIVHIRGYFIYKFKCTSTWKSIQ